MNVLIRTTPLKLAFLRILTPTSFDILRVITLGFN